jgi:cellobiose-specific phosphotransferase system component IIC
MDGRLVFWCMAVSVAAVMILARRQIGPMFPPDDYARDWYGWLVNQTSHVALGVLIVLVAAMIGRALIGEYPYRLELAAIALAYVLIFEVLVQPWNGADTVQDVAFMGVYGVGGALLVFREIEPGRVEVVSDLWLAALVAAVVVLHLVAGVWVRR